jgi:hypothetical protein
MSISIDHPAEPRTRLPAKKRGAVAAIVGRFSVDDQIEEHERTGLGPKWESVRLYDAMSVPDEIVDGAAKLPDHCEDVMWIGIQRGRVGLPELHLSLPDAGRRIAVDDHELMRNGAAQKYDSLA